MSASSLLLVLDLAGTFAFALNGAFTAVRSVHLDIVGVLTLGVITAIGGGVVRDVLIGAVPPVGFSHWQYLVVAGSGALVAFFLSRWLERFVLPLVALDAAGLSLFCITGASKALDVGLGAGQAIILGAITAVGGGTLRDVLIGRIPSVLTSGLYAVPALLGASVTVVAALLGRDGSLAALLAAGLCFVVRMLGVHFDVHAPKPPAQSRQRPLDIG